MQGDGVWRACGTHVVESTDGPTPVQTQRTPLHIASENGCTDAVQVLVDSKANMEARDEVAMLPDAWCVP